MAIDQSKIYIVSGRNGEALKLPPFPIVAQRDPTTRDDGQIGHVWINEADQTAWMMVSNENGVNTWTTSPASGLGTFTSVTVTPGDVDITDGDLNVTLGNIDVAAGNVSIAGDLTVMGLTTLSGDIDFASSALIDFVSTLDAAPSILLHANGGTSESIELHSDQGTSVTSINIHSDVGGVTLASGLASADAINLSASAGGVDIDGALQVNIASSQNAASAIVINASAGGIDITAAGAATEDIDIVNTAGSINIIAGESAADSIFISSTIGGINIVAAGATPGEDIDITATGSSINIVATEAAADAIVLNASDAVGGVQIQAGSNGILIGNQADCAVIDVGDIAPTATRLITIGGGTVVTAAVTDTIDIGVDGATTNADSIKTVNIATGGVTLGENNLNLATGNRTSGTHLVNVSTGTGTKTVNCGNADGLTTVNIDAITLINDSINVNTSINTGTSTGAVAIGNSLAGAITLDSAAGISLDAAAASNFTTSGAGVDILLDATAGRVILDGGEAAVDAVTIGATNAAGGVDVNAGTGGITIDSTGAISIDAAAASNFTATGAGIDLTLSSVGGSVLVESTEDAANAIRLHANGGVTETIQLHADQGTAVNSVYLLSDVGGLTLEATGLASADAINITATAGGIDMDSALLTSITSTRDNAQAILVEATAGGIDILASGAAAGEDIDIVATGSSVNITSTENAADSIVITSTVGGIDISAAGAGAGEDIDITATGSSVNIIATEATADAIVLNASNAAGGIDLLTGGGEITISSAGNVTMAPATATAASPTSTVVINARVGVATYTGFTTASGADVDLTITNSALGVGDGIFVTVSNTGTNDADIQLEGVITQTAGTITLHCINQGPAALNGSIIVTFWIIN